VTGSMVWYSSSIPMVKVGGMGTTWAVASANPNRPIWRRTV
jgi:hypothetical protein